MNKLPVYKIAALSTIVAVLAADQLSKWLMMEMVLRPHLTGETGTGFFTWLTSVTERLHYTEIKILPFFNLVMVWNQGVSFGLFNQSQDLGAMILIAVSLLVSAGFIFWLVRSATKLQAFCLAMVVGGALGNVIDRARFGAVIDFLDFHAAGYHYPAFNVADSAIVIGVILLIIHSLFLENMAQKQLH